MSAASAHSTGAPRRRAATLTRVSLHQVRVRGLHHRDNLRPQSLAGTLRQPLEARELGRCHDAQSQAEGAVSSHAGSGQHADTERAT